MAKRVFDLFWAGLGLVVLSPFLLLVAFLVRLQDRGPAFFLQERVGKNGKSFRIAKFRTMGVGAEKIGRSITAQGDPRITRLGRILRRYKIDELPQLWNVFVGEMSLVGPRPEVPKYVK